MIKKRLLLLIGVMLILGLAPAAMAEHCLRCRATTNPQWVGCIPATGTLLPGHTECYETDTTCWVAGEECAPHGGGLAPLATEFTVASVERLDGPRTNAGETLIAAADLQQPPKR